MVDLKALREGEPSEESDYQVAERGNPEVHFLDSEAKWERLAQFRQNREERKNYASRIFKLVCIWLAFIGVLLLLQGFLGPSGYFAHADSVLIAVSTTTTGSVTVILIVVARHLFPPEPRAVKPDPKE